MPPQISEADMQRAMKIFSEKTAGISDMLIIGELTYTVQGLYREMEQRTPLGYKAASLVLLHEDGLHF